MTRLRRFRATLRALSKIMIPVYVTRKDADGKIGAWSVSAPVGVFLLLLVLTNVVLWGVAGIIAAVGVIL